MIAAAGPVAALIAVLAAGPAFAVKPAPGLYAAQPAEPKGIYQPGVFAVVAEGGKRRIVAAEGYAGIYYPDPGKCDSLEMPLAAESIRISAKGKFEVRDRTPLLNGSIVVVWKGKWVKRRRAAGTLRISRGDCSSKIAWVAKRAKPRPGSARSPTGATGPPPKRGR